MPVVDAAEEAAQFMTSGKQALKSDKPVAPVEERSWEGHLCCCFGRCDSVGWGACLISYFAPCVAFGCVQPGPSADLSPTRPGYTAHAVVSSCSVRSPPCAPMRELRS